MAKNNWKNNWILKFPVIFIFSKILMKWYSIIFSIFIFSLLGKGDLYAHISKNSTFKEYASYYLNEHRRKGLRGKQIEQTTMSCYVDRIKLINKYIGNKKIAELTFEDLENCINELHIKNCDTTARQARDIVVSIMKYAFKDGVVEENEEITLKERKGRNEKKVIKEKDLKTFIDYCMENKCY